MKPIRLTAHAVQQCVERGASEAEVQEAIERGVREPAMRGRFMARLNFQYGARCQDRFCAIKCGHKTSCSRGRGKSKMKSS